MTKNSTLIWTSLCMAVSGLACSDSGDVEIGRNGGNALSDYAAEWDGYAEAFTFWDGSSRVRVSLDSNGHGTLRLGDAPLFPPATDPNVGYGPSPKQFLRISGFAVPGFAYTIQNAQVLGSRLQVTAPTADPYRAWCELQTPFAVRDSDGSVLAYACLPGEGDPFDSNNQQCTIKWYTSNGTSESKDADCGKYALCGSGWPFGTCHCSATACTVNLENFVPAQLDAAMEDGGARLTGTLALTSADIRMTVRLQRQ